MIRFLIIGLMLSLCESVACQTMEDDFRNPPAETKPLIIWQWMDGLISKEGITADLEAYEKAGIGGVQNFQVGGPLQALARDTTNAIGSEKWQQLMKFAIDECSRLGLSFGTHNCPGWSSSALPASSITSSSCVQKTALRLPISNRYLKSSSLSWCVPGTATAPSLWSARIANQNW